MRDEIVAGLRNAIVRGQSLEQAVQSFINAGYNPQEVKAAAQIISTGVSSIVYPRPSKSVSQPQAKSRTPAAPFAPSPPKEEDKHTLPQSPKTSVRQKGGGKVGIIIFIIFLLLVFVSAIAYLIYYLAS